MGPRGVPKRRLLLPVGSVDSDGPGPAPTGVLAVPEAPTVGMVEEDEVPRRGRAGPVGRGGG